jgi:L,D-peptidoglycan transpeptidase YkuD (ErfK/YbiS/YcfS/YnhG family)
MLSLTAVDGWCDDPTDPAYNCFIKTPYPAHHEELWRKDHVYDILIVVGYNDEPVIPPKGSAIFIHLLNDDQTPTDGCIALARGDLIDILAELSPLSELVIPDHLDDPIISPLPSTPLQEKRP